MPGLYGSAGDFAALAQRLKDAGETGLRRRLYKAISDAADPLAAELRNPAHLRPYMPDRYADVLAGDLDVTTLKRAGASPSIRIRVQSYRPRNRKVIQLDQGVISHPLYGDREHWYRQYGGMMPGFFTDAVKETGPQVREACLAALRDTAEQIARK